MKFIAFSYPLIILMDVIIFINFYQWNQQSVYEFEQRQLDLQVNYAIEAAASEMLKSGTNIDTDYSDWGNMTVEPEIALDTYLTVLLRNFGWSDTEQNRDDLINGSVPFFLVAAYDGYYVYGTVAEAVDTGATDANGYPAYELAYPKRWSPKLPYSDTIKTGSNFRTFLYNLGTTDFDVIDNGGLYIDDRLYGTHYTSEASVTRSRTIISNILVKACNAALYSGLEGRTDVEFYLPDSYSTWSETNPVTSPSVLVYVKRSDSSSIYNVVTFGIGGAKIDEAEFFICYKNESGKKVYARAEYRQDVETNRGLQVLEVTSSMEESASKGYYYDLSYLRR